MAENGKGSSNFHGSDAAGTIMDYNENLVLENDDFGFLVALQPTATTENFWTEVYAADMSLVPNELLAPWVNESEEYFSRCGSLVSDQFP
ncbi:hypothetical protein glysoja_001317 [Glycine soja]|nr:hypothetical protein glysoja_001317 [Glycine soja]